MPTTMRRSTVAQVRVTTARNVPVIRIPTQVLEQINAAPGDTLYWCVFDGTLQLTKEQPALSIPVLGRSTEKFKPQRESDGDDCEDDDDSEGGN